MEGMLTLKEVVEYLELEQPEVETLVKKRKLDAYKIGGAFLRFKKDQVVELKAALSKRKTSKSAVFFSKSRDLWYFNRVYILSAILLALVFYLWMK
jgi:excisionase family DNA binding protein